MPPTPGDIESNHPFAFGTELPGRSRTKRRLRLDNGRLVLAATSWLRETGAEDGIVMTSHDEGISWSPPREVMHGDLTYLGGQK